MVVALGKSGPIGRTLLDEAGEAAGAAARAIGGAAALAIGGPRPLQRSRRRRPRID